MANVLPTLSKKLMLSVAVLPSFFMMGVQSDPGPVLVARAATLNPAPLVVTPPEPVVEQTVVYAAEAPKQAPVAASGGRSGYVMAGSNCVTCVRALTGRGQNGNAGTWRPTSSVPTIGAIMIFRAGEQGAGSAGHVGVVTGIIGGKIQLAHCNFPGKTEFSSTGKFY